MVWFVPFSQKPYFSFFIIKMCILEKLNIYNYKSSPNIQGVFFFQKSKIQNCFVMQNLQIN